MTDLAALIVRLQADNSQYIKALDQATGKLTKFTEDQGHAFSELGSKIAEFFAAEKFAELVKGAIESEAALADLSQSAGVSIAKLQELQLATSANGLTQEDLATAFKHLNSAISEATGDGTSKAAIAFKALGISMDDIKGKSPDEVFRVLAERFPNLADGANKAAATQDLLGKSYQRFIPVLNEGVEGLDRYAQKAKDAGLVNEDLATDSKKFSDSIGELKAVFIDGFGKQLAADLLPTLQKLVDSLNNNQGAISSIGKFAQQLSDEFATLAKVGASLNGPLEIVEGVLIGIANATKALLFLHPGDAFQAIKDGIAQFGKGVADTYDTIVPDVQAGNDAIKTSSEETAKQLQAINQFAATEVASPTALKGQQDAIKKLKDFSTELQAQASAFGKGTAATTIAKLSTEDYKKAIADAGAEGAKFVASIKATAVALQLQQEQKVGKDLTDQLLEQINTYHVSAEAANDYKLHTGDLGKALDDLAKHGKDLRPQLQDLFADQQFAKNRDAIKGIDIAILNLTGHYSEAAAEQRKLADQQLRLDLANDPGAIAKLDKQEALNKAVDQYNDLVAQSAQVQQNFELEIANVQSLADRGNITSIDAQHQINDLNQQQIAQLGQIYTARKQISDDSGIPKLQADTKAFQLQLTQLGQQTDLLAKQIRGDLEDAFADELLAAEQGTKSLSQAFRDMVKDIQASLLKIANKSIAEQIFGTGGAAGGSAGFLAGLFGGGGTGGTGAGSTLGNAGGSILSGLKSLFGGGSSAISVNAGSNLGAIDTSSIYDDLLGQSSANLAGAFAGGGTIPGGSYGLVGERGPELVYAGSKNMNVVPNGQTFGRSTNVTNNFAVTAPNGVIQKASQNQTAAAAARSVGSASRRNNR